MKATGIVRRIDDLGRIVIPKEIRRSFRIKEGDPLEIFTNADGEVISTESILPLTLTGDGDGAELTCDLSALMEMDAELTLCAYPGKSFVERPKKFIGIADWDEDTLGRFEQAAEQFAALFGGMTG